MQRPELDAALAKLQSVDPHERTGRVTSVVGLVVRAKMPELELGQIVEVERNGPPLLAEVVGFGRDEAVLIPYADLQGVGPHCRVKAQAGPLAISCGNQLLGRVLDGLGQPIDGGPMLPEMERWSVERSAPAPLSRPVIERPFRTGVRVIDGFLTLGRGQRVGLFAGAGVGKSTLLGQLVRAGGADVNVVCLVGERGREVKEFIEESLGEEGLKRSVVVCATSDAPSIVRLKSAFVATAIAEWFRDRQSANVLLLMDSLTRFARAQREVGLSAGEPPARHGYPPSVFAMLPRLLERSGNSEYGNMTAIYTVLVAGGDMEEPISDEVRGILDGHIILSRELAERGRLPAVDVPKSLSRVMNNVVAASHDEAARQLRALIAAYEAKREMIHLGAYRRGSDATVDRALDLASEIDAFLSQGRYEFTEFETTCRQLAALAAKQLRSD